MPPYERWRRAVFVMDRTAGGEKNGAVSVHHLPCLTGSRDLRIGDYDLAVIRNVQCTT